MQAELEAVLRRLDETQPWEVRRDLAIELLNAVRFPPGEEIVRVEELNAQQREVAEALGRRTRVYIDTHAIPSSNRIRRRWIGLDPAGPLEKVAAYTVGGEEREGPRWWLWRTLEEAGDDEEVEGLFEGPLERLEAFAELELADDEGYRLEPCLDVLDDLEAAGADAAPWAKGFADELLELFATGERLPENGMRSRISDALKLVAFVPLALAGKPFQARWELLIPVTRNRAFMQAVATMLPENRREDLLLERLEDSMILTGLDGALHVLARFPLKRIAAWLFGVLADPATARALDRTMVRDRLKALQQLGAENAVIAEALAPR